MCPDCAEPTSHGQQCRACRAAISLRLPGQCGECGGTDGFHAEGQCSQWRDDGPPRDEEEAARYNASGRLIHEPGVTDGERLDRYLARVRPEIGDQPFWEAECEAGRIEVRDSFSLATGTFSGRGWFVRWYDGAHWRALSLEDAERPRMRDGYCHIVQEATAS